MICESIRQIACGTNCSCGSNCQCGTHSSDLSPELYELNFPRRVPADILDMIESERQERISSGINPLLYAKIFRCQTELMHSHIGTSLLNDARAQVTSLKGSTRDTASSFSGKMHQVGEVISNFTHRIVESVKEKEAELEIRVKPIIENFDHQALEFSLATNKRFAEWTHKSSDIAHDVIEAEHEVALAAHHKVNKFAESLKESGKEVRAKAADISASASDIVSDMKDKFTGIDISSIAAEEKERSRRMSEKIDPLVDGRKHRMEDELLQNIKPVN